MNKDILKDAISNGIDSNAVNATIGDVISYSDKINNSPKQVKDVLETIVEMKKNVNSIPDKKYASEMVRNNSERIKSALNEGISPSEIAQTLMESVEKANNRRTKSRLKFITKLIVKMKQKELVLQNKMEKGIQKVLK